MLARRWRWNCIAKEESRCEAMGELAGLGEDYWAADKLRAQYCVSINYSLDKLDVDRATSSRLKEG